MKRLGLTMVMALGLGTGFAGIQNASAAALLHPPSVEQISNVSNIHHRRIIRRNNGAAIAGALIGGIIIGSAIANQNRGVRVRRVYRTSDPHVNWCFRRYRSYRAWDNTFQPYRGPRRLCYSPYY